jgi:hypothetical protein
MNLPAAYFPMNDRALLVMYLLVFIRKGGGSPGNRVSLLACEMMHLNAEHPMAPKHAKEMLKLNP